MKNIKYSIIIIFITLLIFILLEVLMRFAVSIKNKNYKYLSYGFKFNNTIYSTLGLPNYNPYPDGYFAFPKNKIFKRSDWASKPIKINNLGLRGPGIKINKEQETIRIVAMGASSTFGYTVNDYETYSAVLEKKLNEKMLNKKFEVINAGLPWLTSNEILLLLEKLIINLNPDIITFYIGFNDSSHLNEKQLILRTFGKLLGNFYLNFKNFSEYSYIGHYFYYRINRQMGKYYNFFTDPIKSTELNKLLVQNLNIFSNNLIKINEICKNNKIDCYFISQISSPISSYKKFNINKLNKIKELNYNSYNTFLKDKINKGGGLSDIIELNNFVQFKFNDYIRKNKEFSFLDFTKDHTDDFNILNTYVHLNIDGNESLATFIYEELFKNKFK